MQSSRSCPPPTTSLLEIHSHPWECSRWRQQLWERSTEHFSAGAHVSTVGHRGLSRHTPMTLGSKYLPGAGPRPTRLPPLQTREVGRLLAQVPSGNWMHSGQQCCCPPALMGFKRFRAVLVQQGAQQHTTSGPGILRKGCNCTTRGAQDHCDCTFAPSRQKSTEQPHLEGHLQIGPSHHKNTSRAGTGQARAALASRGPEKPPYKKDNPT